MISVKVTKFGLFFKRYNTDVNIQIPDRIDVNSIYDIANDLGFFNKVPKPNEIIFNYVGGIKKRVAGKRFSIKELMHIDFNSFYLSIQTHISNYKGYGLTLKGVYYKTEYKFFPKEIEYKVRSKYYGYSLHPSKLKDTLETIGYNSSVEKFRLSIKHFDGSVFMNEIMDFDFETNPDFVRIKIKGGRQKEPKIPKNFSYFELSKNILKRIRSDLDLERKVDDLILKESKMIR